MFINPSCWTDGDFAMAGKGKGISDEEFDKIAEAYLEEKFEAKFGSGSKNKRDELMKKLKKIKMAVGGMAAKKTATKKMRGGGMAGKAKAAKKMMRGGVAKKKMRGGGMAKMAQKKMMRGGMAKKKMMRGGAVKKK